MTVSPVITNLCVLTWPTSINTHLNPNASATSLSWMVSPNNRVCSGIILELFNQFFPASILPLAFSLSTPMI